MDFNWEFSALLAEDKFIARSDYKLLIKKYKEVYTFFDNAKKANTLTYYCKQNGLLASEIYKFLEGYKDKSIIIKKSISSYR